MSQAGPPGYREPLRAYPPHPEVQKLADDFRRRGMHAAADALLLPTGPTNAPGSWWDVGLILGPECLLRICKIAGAA